jgi:hypothetical protein
LWFLFCKWKNIGQIDIDSHVLDPTEADENFRVCESRNCQTVLEYAKMFLSKPIMRNTFIKVVPLLNTTSSY